MTDARVTLVVKAVSAFFNVSEKSIRSHLGAYRKGILYRQIAIYLCWKLFQLNNELLVSEFRIRDASVLLYGIYKIETLKGSKGVLELNETLDKLTPIIMELDEMRRSV